MIHLQIKPTLINKTYASKVITSAICFSFHQYLYTQHFEPFQCDGETPLSDHYTPPNKLNMIRNDKHKQF